MMEKERIVQELEALQQNQAYRELKSRNRILETIIIFGKKTIRRCLRWYIDPICQQQSEFNAYVTEGIRVCLQSEAEQMNILSAELKEIKGELVKLIDLQTENSNGFFSVAQAGEDGILRYILSTLHYRMEDVTYVDLGANHAKFLSNTFSLYSMGARGVLVEANPHLIPELEANRKGDIIINRCVDLDGEKEISFYILNGDGLSTPSYEAAQEFIKRNQDLQIVETINVETITVNDIFEQYLQKAPTVLNIDIEGNELNILKAINFEKFRPLIIICEMIEYKKGLTVGEKNQETMAYMLEEGYFEYANTGINSIFIDGKQVN